MIAHDDLRRQAKRANEMEPEWKWREWALDSPSTVGELIDAFSPQAILALLDERDALEREVCACRAALEEVGYTGSLPEGVYDRLERERDAARSEAASHLAALEVVAQKRDEARADLDRADAAVVHAHGECPCCDAVRAALDAARETP